MKRTFEINVRGKYDSSFSLEKRATDHRSAAMLVVQEFALNHEYEIDINEVIKLPKSTYVIFEHTSTQIEQKC